MNITDAFLVHPYAVEHARKVLGGELDMLSRGIGKSKRREWLIAQRNQLLTDAPLFVPTTLAPVLQTISESEAIAALGIVNNNLQALGMGSSIRALRNAQRRLALPDDILDVATLNGAILLLSNDEAFTQTLRNAFSPFLEHILNTEDVKGAEQQYNQIMASDESQEIQHQKANSLGHADATTSISVVTGITNNSGA